MPRNICLSDLLREGHHDQRLNQDPDLLVGLTCNSRQRLMTECACNAHYLRFVVELHSTLLDAGYPKPDLVAVHAAVPDLQHLLVPSQGGGKRLKDGRFQTGCIWQRSTFNRSTRELLLYDWSVTKSRLDPGSADGLGEFLPSTEISGDGGTLDCLSASAPDMSPQPNVWLCAWYVVLVSNAARALFS